MASAKSGTSKSGSTAGKGTAQSAAKRAARPAGKSAPKPAAKGAARTGGKTGSKAGTKAGSKTASKSGSRTASRTGNKTGAKAGSKSARRSRGVQENPLAARNSAVLMVEGGAPERSAPARGGSKPKNSAQVRKKGGAAQVRPARETYDESDRPRGSRGGGSQRKGGRGFGVVNLALLTAILALAGIGAWRAMEYRTLSEMKQVVSSQTFYQGTTVEGVDVSGMTLQEALDYWDRQIEPTYRQAAVVMDDGTRVTAAELGYSSNYEEVLAGAWNAGRSGSLRQRYLRASAGSAKDYPVERVRFDDEMVRQYAAGMAAQVDAAPADAHVAGFDAQTYAFEFAPEQEGRKLDQDALINAIESALNAGGGTIVRRIETLAPGVTMENVEAQYGMIASAVTNASSSSNNRLSNIRLAVSIINGTRLAPGEQFSFNEVVGERTASRGFKVATAYSSGTVTEEVGGGICQVSTTLFNAAVKADLRIDERHSHSLTVSYVDLGKDAAVDWGGKNLRFTNTSDDDVYICCMVTDDKRVRFGVFGKLLPNGETITVEGVKTGEIDFETQYQTSFELYSGQTRRLQEGKKGYTATAYKVRWDAAGNELSREKLCESRYQPTPEIIEYGP